MFLSVFFLLFDWQRWRWHFEYGLTSCADGADLAKDGEADRADEADVDEISERANGFSIVPALVVHPLSDNLNWRLSTVFFKRGHVEIVNKEDRHF